MRARHHEAAHEATCPRCAALLRPAVATCSLCGWSVASPFPGSVATSPPAALTEAAPPSEPSVPLSEQPGAVAEEPLVAGLDALAAAQLEVLDALSGDGPAPEEPTAATAPLTMPGSTTRAPTGGQTATHTLDPLTAPLALLTGEDAWLPEPDVARPVVQPSDDAVLEADAYPAVLEADAYPAVLEAEADPTATKVSGLPPAPRPLRRLAGAFVLISGLVAGLAVGRAVLIAATAGRTSLEGATALAVIGLSAALFSSVVCLAIALVLWVPRARSNAQAQSVRAHRWSPTLAVAGWFIPVAGLFIGWQVLQDLWAAADPETRDNPAARAPEPPLVTGWLAGLAVSSVVWLAGSVVLGGSPLVDVVSALALGVSAVCLGLAVRRISGWQDPAAAPAAS